MAAIDPIEDAAPRFLVLRGGAIGDFVVTLPVLQALKARWPRAEIEIWGYPHIARLAVAGGLARSVVSLDRAEMAKFYVPVMDITPEIEAKIRSFDLVFNYLHDPEGQIRSNLLLAGAKQVLSGSPIVKRGHASRFLLEPLMDLALYDAPDVPALDIAPDPSLLARAGVNPDGPSPVALHPGSGGEHKKWPLERFFALADRLFAAGHPVVWVLGEADDRERAALLASRAGEPRLDGLPLEQLAAALGACAAYAGNDSGVTHLAAAVGLPVVAVFGPTDPDTWGPKGRGGVRVVRAPDGDLSKLDDAGVWNALAELLAP
jgi:heptosyltransferase-2